MFKVFSNEVETILEGSFETLKKAQNFAKKLGKKSIICVVVQEL